MTKLEQLINNKLIMQDDSQRLGKWMIWAAWLLLLIFLTLFFNDQLARLINPNQNVEGHVNSSGVHELVLERNRAGHYVATGYINDKPVTFLLDTGASNVVVPAQIAMHLELEPGATLRFQTANGSTIGYHTFIDKIRLGSIELRNVNGSINPSMDEDFVLLGMTFLKHLEFTQRGNELILRQPKAGN